MEIPRADKQTAEGSFQRIGANTGQACNNLQGCNNGKRYVRYMSACNRVIVSVSKYSIAAFSELTGGSFANCGAAEKKEKEIASVKNPGRESGGGWRCIFLSVFAACSSVREMRRRFGITTPPHHRKEGEMEADRKRNCLLFPSLSPPIVLTEGGIALGGRKRRRKRCKGSKMQPIPPSSPINLRLRIRARISPYSPFPFLEILTCSAHFLGPAPSVSGVGRKQHKTELSSCEAHVWDTDVSLTHTQ